MTPDEGLIEFVIEGAPGRRLDTYLAQRLDLSRSRVEQLISAGQVEINDAVPKKRDQLQPGDRVRVRLPPPEPTHIAGEPIPIEIVFEDGDLAVVDKPPGLVVHPAPGHRSGTLVNALLHRLDDLSGIGGVLRPGIVHRLDRDTSGLMIVAKNDRAHRALADALQGRRIRRRYLAAAWGHLRESATTVDAPIGRHAGDRKRMAVRDDGRRATTQFRVLERWRAAELLEADLETGRTHQIRVHLLHIGHPVVGDRTYAVERERGFSGPERAWAIALARRTPRQFLHAAELTFHHPRTGIPLVFESPLPPDLAAVADWARTGKV
ncbi:MAG: RluA family pseudouridine synthase [Gemmatimonas sp.]|nr:RluA family pseudouridine synthase [Gemmatimonas sp.]